MITSQQMMDATALPPVAELCFDAFSEQDLVNLIMQRSRIIFDQPRSGRITKAWSAGNTDPALSLVEKHGIELAKRAAAVIYLEYLQIRDTLQDLNPRSVADIGCGYAMFDLFLWKDRQCSLNLIDLETSEERHFGYQEKGAAYSSLSVAQSFLTQNGVDSSDITCLNPRTDDLGEVGPIDLAMSFISCGFHYPVKTYETFFKTAVKPNGAIILDLRPRQSREGRRILKELGSVSSLIDTETGGTDRVLVRKQ